MEIERENIGVGRMPVDVYEQMANLPSMEEQERICRWLFAKVLRVLVENGIGVNVKKSSYRVKSDEGVMGKIITRGSTRPVKDKFGVRLIVSEEDRFRISGMIRDAFPLTPDFFEDGVPSIRDYADPQMRFFIRANFNPNISSEYSALHVNGVFLTPDSEKKKIVEVQVMTNKEDADYKRTREIYKNGRIRNSNQR